MNKILATVTHLLLTLVIFTVSVEAETLRPKTVLSLEGSYFKPRRAEFKELYGNEFPVVGIRLDLPISKKNSVGIRGRYLRMHEIDSLVFTNFSMGLLIKRVFPENEITDFYLAGGIQMEFRKVVATLSVRNVSGQVVGTRSFRQQEFALSLNIEGGIDIWVLSRIKLSPHVGFIYFPFGDPTTGDFGDTGGFMFSASLGFRL